MKRADVTHGKVRGYHSECRTYELVPRGRRTVWCSVCDVEVYRRGVEPRLPWWARPATKWRQKVLHSMSTGWWCPR